MVKTHGPDDEYFDYLQEMWPSERPTRRPRRKGRRDKKVVVHAKRRDQIDAARISQALLAAQREMERLQAEADARGSGGSA